MSRSGLSMGYIHCSIRCGNEYSNCGKYHVSVMQNVDIVLLGEAVIPTAVPGCEHIGIFLKRSRKL